MKIRVSIATASMLGLKNYSLSAQPETLYFLLSGECEGKCMYCNQKNGYLARVRWPEFDFNEVNKRIKYAKAGRICFQCLYGKRYIKMIEDIVEKIDSEIPVSVSMNAVEEKEMKILREKGVERIGIGLDCASKRIFARWKKNVPSWNEHLNSVIKAKKIFGNATCHLIAGLGENDEEIVNLMSYLSKKGVKIALFAYFKNNETLVDLSRYRTIQIARYFLEKGKGKFYFENGKIVEMEIPYLSEEPFLTSGCPSCNRPFYNERVTKIYNYPYKIGRSVAEEAFKEAEKYARIYIVD